MSENKFKRFTSNMFRIGTPECAIFCTVLALVLAVLFLLAGFWRTLLIVLLMLLGAFIGGVQDKKQWFKDRVNKLFPAPQAYREDNEAIVKAVREATGSQAEAASENDTEE